MSVTDLPRAALGAYLKVLRTPVDLALKATGRSGTAKVAVDRADAAAREVAATALNDRELKQDAGRRRAAADAREEAIELRASAEKTAKKGSKQRASTAQAAERRRKQATAKRESAEQKLATAAKRRKAASTKAAARQEERIEEEAKRERLEQLDEEAKALDEREEALVARDEANRLEEATASAKAARKAS